MLLTVAVVVLSYGICSYICVTTTIAAIVATHQEYKLWKHHPTQPLTSVHGIVKVYLFNVFWMTACCIGTVFIVLKYAVTFGKSDIARDAHAIVQNYAAHLLIRIFIGDVVVIDNTENNDNATNKPAPIYVSNHASQIDAAAMYYLNVERFKWIAKQSVLYIPGVGSTMYLANHILIQRRRKKPKATQQTTTESSTSSSKESTSRSNLYEKCVESLCTENIPVFFFPQGTRQMVGPSLPFKDGAFIAAQIAKSDIVPISIHIPDTVWNSYYPVVRNDRSVVTLTVHKRIVLDHTTDNDTTSVASTEYRNTVKEQCGKQIYSVLPTKQSSTKKKD